MAAVKTRIFVISDTHGERLHHIPLESVDVAIHCGDITEESKLHEYQTSLDMLKSIDAPLKLVIAGNHDWSMDRTAHSNMLEEARRVNDVSQAELEQEYGIFDDISQAQALFETEDAKTAGVRFLAEGSYTFTLTNGAALTVYASPFTPMEDGHMGFHYEPSNPHSWQFAENKDIDILITHGPPQGMFDMADRKRLGCPSLFAAVAQARPRMHCFGHVHAGWGAKLVTWRDEMTEHPSHLTDINNDESHPICSLSALRESKYDSEETIAKKTHERMVLEQRGHAVVNKSVSKGVQTLFVNAAIKGAAGEPQRLPWIIGSTSQ